MKRILIRALIILTSIYIILCISFYFFQEKLIFYPQKLDKNYRFSFNQNFEEINIKTEDGIILNSLLFKAKESKGLIFYLHGNAGALNSWGQIAPLYTDFGYDILFTDYRGFGKSGGNINSQSQLFSDTQEVYDKIKTRYDENRIVILGFSIGTGIASKMASENNPKMLILQAPYYSLTDVIQNYCPIIPNFIVKYKLETYKYISKCKMPITIFHGDKDDVINYSNSVKLKELLKDTDTMITLEDEKHNTIISSKEYQMRISEILNK